MCERAFAQSGQLKTHIQGYHKGITNIADIKTEVITDDQEENEAEFMDNEEIPLKKKITKVKKVKKKKVVNVKEENFTYLVENPHEFYL